MARLAALWRRSNLVKLLTLKKRNHPGEAQVRRGGRKDLCRRERGTPYKDPMRTWEELGLQRRYMFRKGKSAVEGDPKKSRSGIETEAGAE